MIRCHLCALRTRVGISSPLLRSGRPRWPLADPSVGLGSTLASPRRIVDRNLPDAWVSGRFGDGHLPSPSTTVPLEHATSAPLRTCRLQQLETGGAPTRLDVSPTVAPLRRPLHSTVSTLSELVTTTLWRLPLPGPFQESRCNLVFR